MNDKKKTALPMILGCVILFAVILALGIGVMLGVGGEEPTIAPTSGMVHTTGDAATDGLEPSSAGTVTEEQSAALPTQESVSTPQTDPAPETKPTQKPTEPVTQPPVTIPQMKEASYEQWLSASMVVGLSMSYPDFQLQGIYVAGETALEDKMSSGGAVIRFTSGGKELALRSTPLEAERDTAGTIDLSTQTLGFATFDVVDASAVNTAAMTEVALEDLGELIEQSLLVSLYWH